MPSEAYKKQEAENAKKASEAEHQEAIDSAVIYWTYPKKFRLANWVEEERLQSGMINRSEQSLPGEDHIISCDANTPIGKKKIAYIEASNAFASKQIIRCKDMAEAQRRTREQNIKLSVRESRAQDISSTEITLPDK